MKQTQVFGNFFIFFIKIDKFTHFSSCSNSSLLTDGKDVVVGTKNGIVEVWSLATGKKRGTLSDPQIQAEISCMVIGESVLVSGGSDNSICKWQ